MKEFRTVSLSSKRARNGVGERMDESEMWSKQPKQLTTIYLFGIFPFLLPFGFHFPVQDSIGNACKLSVCAGLNTALC